MGKSEMMYVIVLKSVLNFFGLVGSAAANAILNKALFQRVEN